MVEGSYGVPFEYGKVQYPPLANWAAIAVPTNQLGWFGCCIPHTYTTFDSFLCRGAQMPYIYIYI